MHFCLCSEALLMQQISFASKQEGFVLHFRSNEGPGFDLTRLKSTRSCLHRARERAEEARECRLGEQAAFCVHPHVHKFEVLPGEKQQFRV